MRRSWRRSRFRRQIWWCCSTRSPARTPRSAAALRSEPTLRLRAEHESFVSAHHLGSLATAGRCRPCAGTSHVWHCRNDKVSPVSIRAETPMKIPQTVREVIEKGPLAHLTTLNPNGSPQVTVVWVGIEGEEFVMGHLAVHQKVKNIRRDPRVALSLLGYNTTQGMREYVVVYGTARVTEGGAVPLLQRLAPIYLGPGAEYPPASMRNIAGYVTRITPSRFSGIGPWAQQATG